MRSPTSSVSVSESRILTFGAYNIAISFRESRYGVDGFDDKRKETFPSLLTITFVR
jgi:hypothetical protein